MQTFPIESLNRHLLNNQVARFNGDEVVIDIYRGSATLHSQRKVAEIAISQKEAFALFAESPSLFYRKIQTMDFDLDIPYSRFD